MRNGYEADPTLYFHRGRCRLVRTHPHTHRTARSTWTTTEVVDSEPCLSTTVSSGHPSSPSRFNSWSGHRLPAGLALERQTLGRGLPGRRLLPSSSLGRRGLILAENSYHSGTMLRARLVCVTRRWRFRRRRRRRNAGGLMMTFESQIGAGDVYEPPVQRCRGFCSAMKSSIAEARWQNTELWRLDSPAPPECLWPYGEDRLWWVSEYSAHACPHGPVACCK